MKRQDKYPDTDYFKFFNANPKGKYTNDCVIRALCTAMHLPWKSVYEDLHNIGLKYGLMPNDPKCFHRYLKDNGWVKHEQPRKNNNSKYTGKEFMDEFQSTLIDTAVIANIGGRHTVAIMCGRVWDTWDSSDGCIGNYWTKY